MLPPSPTTSTAAEAAAAVAACEYDRRRPLFDGTLPVELVAAARAGGTRERQPLTLRVLRGTRARGERVLRLEVTTDASAGAMASFLYSLDVGEVDFPELKRDQSLLVDFAAFPAKLVEMIQGCCCCCPPASVSDAAAAPPAQFSARLDTTQAPAVLSVVEATPFKELTHLALRLRPAHDAALKEYLAGRLRLTLALAEEYRLGMDGAEARAAQQEERARALEAAAAQKAAAHEEELARVKARHEQELAALRAQQEAEARSLREQRDQVVGSLQRRLDETERRRVALQDAKRTQEGEIRELNRKVQGLEGSLEAALGENAGLKEAKGRLEAEVGGLRAERAELQRAQAALQQQLGDREESWRQAVALQQAAQQGQARAEEALALYKGNALQLQERLEGSVAEIQRGNQIIARLQAEGQGLKQKLRTRGEALKQQERLLQERQRALDEATHQLESATREAARVGGELAAVAAKLETANKLNESNQQVITWLNKEINDLQLGRGSGLLPMPPVYSSSSSGNPMQNNLSMASGATTGSGSAATYTPSYGRYSGASVHDTTASTISAASSAYLLSPVTATITPAKASSTGSKKGAGSGSGKKKAAATGSAAAMSGTSSNDGSSSSSSSKKKKGTAESGSGVSTIYLDALGLADSTGSLPALLPAAGTAH